MNVSFFSSFLAKQIFMAIDDEMARVLAARIPREKKKYRLPQFSKKKLAQMAAEKKLLSADGDTLKEQWFKARRKEMTGTCQCGCGEPSQKENDIHFRSSAAHIFPKHLFESVKYHPFNWVERRVWAGINSTSACHSIMDDTSMDRWPNMADWEDIKEKCHVLAPLLTVEEKATNFYSKLEKLIYEN